MAYQKSRFPDLKNEIITLNCFSGRLQDLQERLYAKVDHDACIVALALKFDKRFAEIVMNFLAGEAELAQIDWER